MSRLDCQQVIRQIELYLDGELDRSIRIEIHEHLSGCYPCTDLSEFQVRLRALLRAKCGCDDVPPQLTERIRALFVEPSA